jgi:hypothetical protein
MKRRKGKQQKPAQTRTEAKADDASEATGPREYFYSFELTRPYPSVRSFIFKKPLKKSMKDTFSDLLGAKKS